MLQASQKSSEPLRPSKLLTTASHVSGSSRTSDIPPFVMMSIVNFNPSALESGQCFEGFS